MVEIKCPYCGYVFDTSRGLQCPGCGAAWSAPAQKPEVVEVKQIPKKRRSRAWIGPVIGLVVLFIIIFLILYTPLGSYLVHFFSGTPASATFTLKREVSFTSSRPISYEFHMPEPVSCIGQEVRSVSPLEGAGEITVNGTTWYVWKASEKTGGKASVTFTVHAREVKWKVSAGDSGNVSQIPGDLKAKYLGREWKIDPHNTEIKNLATNITKNYTTVYEKLGAIYNYIQKYIRYVRGSAGEPNDPLTTLHTGVGDCDDQSILFCSLARAVGIPAWLELGAIYIQMEGKWGPHAWVRTYIPYKTGSGVYVNIDTANGMFLTRDALRYTDWTSNGNGEDLKFYYFFFTYTYAGPAPSVNLSDRYITISMKTEFA
ncbi:MAG: transglutaminase-like domain-containing protein [Thermoplasmata archaeon]|nr:transglutaminase-like domain-containing protein [Thermoplasmata archaeon]